jgi:hypothetical protein
MAQLSSTSVSAMKGARIFNQQVDDLARPSGFP